MNPLKLEKIYMLKYKKIKTVDAEFLKRLLDLNRESSEKEQPTYLLDEIEEFKGLTILSVWFGTYGNEKNFYALIDYISQNNFVIVPGLYKINQCWNFEDGMFVKSNGEKLEVFKFAKK